MRVRPAVFLIVVLATGCTGTGAAPAPVPTDTEVSSAAAPSSVVPARSTVPTAAPSTATLPPPTTAPTTTTTGTTTPATTSTSTTTVPVDSTTTTAPGASECPGGDDLCAAATAAGAAYLNARVSGGVSGFFALEVGGATTASLNARHGFYPASSIKALQHLAAIRWAVSRPDPSAALDTPVPVSLDPCTAAAPVSTEPLAEVLRAMMIDSDNLRANAVQDLLGLPAIAEAAAAAGMDDTRVVHRFGCGGPANDPANRSTAADLASLFDGVASGRLLDRDASDLFLSFLRRDVPRTLAAAVTASEVSDGAFGAEVHGKAGWWGTDLSYAGLVTLPTSRCPGTPGRTYAAAAFVDGAASVAAGFDVADVIGVVLQDEVRRAAGEYAASACP